MTSDQCRFSLRARSQDGFTLIELLVVIVILGVLAAIVVFSVKGIGDKGHKSAVAADAATLRTAEETFCAKHGHYGTADDLKDDGLLRGDPVYNMVMVGAENKCGRGEKSSFTLNDTSAPTEVGADAIKAGTTPVDLAVDEKDNRVYVVAEGSNDVTVIDGNTDAAIGRPIDVSSAVSSPTTIAVDSDTGRVYVGGAGGVAIIDTKNADQVTHVSGFATTVTGLGVSPENGEVYVGGGGQAPLEVAYIAAGSSSAKAIPLPAPGLGVAPSFSFDSVHHAVYLVKQGFGKGDAADIGLFAISSQTHEAEIAADFAAQPGCGNKAGKVLLQNSAVTVTAVDPVRNLVYLLAKTCVPNPGDPSGTRQGVATTIAINPSDHSSTAIDDPWGTPYIPVSVIYNPAAGSVYAYLDGGDGANCGGKGGRIDRIVGTKVTGLAPVCKSSNAYGSLGRKLALLSNFNRIFVAQQQDSAAPGGLGVADGGTLLSQPPLGKGRKFGALAANNTTGKVYAVDPDNGTVAVFRTGSA
ncbi:prepilin-type N-terminal cleavage/methylation domain-containing protein [Streptomyces sp. SID10853]|uniref:prepilin-type N-terminal cleavage/methylation domain-containing protein n=1 Tax=Streptomyces sp. SID10853 TaxID=2706028 RepID=UPI0013BED5AA|nr:prepilin-type N-terminal cleavage/methylation domain-containing protein [Streptomyces sp. SID10853]NDZ78875.1 prepilin-type N-terminal cleavage/methylation domain-containing protein [Streptomyces sp. SID10853]